MTDWLTDREKEVRQDTQHTDRQTLNQFSKFVLEWIICWTIISNIPPLKFLLCFLCPVGCWQRLFSNEQQRHQDSQWQRLSDLHHFLCCWRSQSIEQKKPFKNNQMFDILKNVSLCLHVYNSESCWQHNSLVRQEISKDHVVWTFTKTNQTKFHLWPTLHTMYDRTSTGSWTYQQSAQKG